MELSRRKLGAIATGCEIRPFQGYRQQGAVLVLVVVGMTALLAMAGLALDTGHLLLNKSRIQNAVDAAALAAAKKLDESHDTVLAEITARDIFADNASAPGNKELDAAYDGGNGDVSVSVQFSSTLNPFVPGSYDPGVTPDGYVRVRADNFRMASWFVTVVGVSELLTDAVAVAGPSPTFTHDDQVCDLAPMMVCGTPQESAAAGTYLGYVLNDVQVLKTSTSNGNFEVGPGNFQLVRLDGGQGGADVREAMAGGGIGCVDSSGGIETEPGNTVGPVVQGLNTRFGEHTGPLRNTEEQYPPDVIVTANTSEINKDETSQVTVTDSGGNVCDGGAMSHADCLTYTWDHYASQVGPGPFDYEPEDSSIGGIVGSRWRRVMKLPIGECSGTTNGQGTVDYLGVGCFFLLQPAVQKGNESHVYGQFIAGCDVDGEAGPEPNNGPGGYRIVLYKDPDSGDS